MFKRSNGHTEMICLFGSIQMINPEVPDTY